MKNHSLLYFLIFICSLVLGYSVSTRFYHANSYIPPNSMRLVPTGSQNSIETMNNGQRSILLISAKSINTSNQHLDSIWLATYFSTDTTIRLLPIFPAGNKLISDLERQLSHSFNLEKTNGKMVLNQDFITVLKNDNLWWSGYIVFDEVALTKLFNIIGGVNLNGRTLTGEQLVTLLPKMLDNPQDAFSSQIVIFQSACNKFQEIASNLDMPQISSLLANHIFTDMNSSQLQTEMQALYTKERKPTCRFPTLEISQVFH
jgi:hypothetical protein